MNDELRAAQTLLNAEARRRFASEIAALLPNERVRDLKRQTIINVAFRAMHRARLPVGAPPLAGLDEAGMTDWQRGFLAGAASMDRAVRGLDVMGVAGWQYTDPCPLCGRRPNAHLRRTMARAGEPRAGR